jgi:heavy metal translocating P-type ATPase
MSTNRFLYFLQVFQIPLIIVLSIILYLLLLQLHIVLLANLIILFSVALGSYGLFKDILHSILKKQFALDYIAVLAVLTSIISGQFLVAAIIALMLSSGETLEAYGIAQAKKSLSLLVDRIPQDITLIENGQSQNKEKIYKIKVGQQIFIRKGEVIPLDGLLVSEQGYTDESSLTGEPYLVEKMKGDIIRSGTINSGQAIVIQVTKVEADSTYKKIIEMVKDAQQEKSPFIRLADKYSTIFTIITLVIAMFAFLRSPHLNSILSVLVIATPCPLIIATPIALLGGINKAAKKRIIIKKLASLEVLDRTNTFVFDKTGTITIGKPELTNIEILNKAYSEKQILSIGQALERNSLHPIAKTIIDAAHKKDAVNHTASDIKEIIGIGISGKIEEKTYTLSRIEKLMQSGMAIILLQDDKQIAIFHFEDSIKNESKQTIMRLKKLGLDLYILTGDKQIIAEKIVKDLGIQLNIRSELKPEQKAEEIKKLKQQKDPKRVIAMIGDGINDAPALALADVGMVFSSEEQTAASEAADIVLLGGDFSLVTDTISIAQRTIKIATQSILAGIGLSILGMILASLGFIPPLFGAGLQEAIDVAVILNALRASK